MRLCRFNADRLGLVRGDRVHDVTDALAALPTCRYPLPRHDLLIAHLPDVLARAQQLLPDSASLAVDEVTLLSPVANPGKIIGAPVNYKKHLDEARTDAGIHHQAPVHDIQRMGLFLKATSSLVGASEGVALRHADRRNDHEAELAVVIGRAGAGISMADAWLHVAGYCIGLDMTTRGTEERSLRKSIDSFTVLGPWLVTPDEIPLPGQLNFSLRVGDELRQHANTRDLIWSIPELIAYASSFYTLHPGDVILTGTPEGVGAVQPGDTMTVEFERIGIMRVAVRAA